MGAVLDQRRARAADRNPAFSGRLPYGVGSSPPHNQVRRKLAFEIGVPDVRGLSTKFPPMGVAETVNGSGNGSAAPPPRSKEFQMKFRLTRSAYLLALLAAFVVASGAGHKLGAP